MKRSITAAILCSINFVNADSQEIKKPSFDNRILFFEGYERIKDDALYFALLAWISPNYLSKSDAWLVEGEARLGYNFAFKNHTTLTPYIGGGYLDDLKKSHRHERRFLRHLKEHTLEYGFGSFGLCVMHSFNDLFGLGFNAKGMVGKGTIGSFVHNNQWTYGFDLGLPLSFSFGHMRRYDIRYEPFYIFLKSKHDESSYLGNRLFVGVKF
jgi:hypothetical protein